MYDRITWEFLKWVWLFRRRQRPVLLDKLADFDGDAIVLRRRRDIDRFLDTIVADEDPALAG